MASRPADGPTAFPRVRTPHRIIPVTPVVWVPEAAPPIASLFELGAGAAELCAADGAALPPLHLVRLPPGAVVFGGGHFVTAAAGRFVASQFPPGLGSEHAAVDAVAPLNLDVREVREEVLLAGRHDIGTWRLWLTALLPAIALVERNFAGRFQLLLPNEIAQAPDSPMAQSLAACGIGPERLFAADPALTYRFEALFALEPVWCDGRPRLDATEALRQACAHIEPAPSPSLVIAPAGPALVALPTPPAAPFIDQVAAFKGAAEVRLAPGADPSFLIFAPSGVRVVAAEQSAFLQALVLDRQGSLVPPDHAPG